MDIQKNKQMWFWLAASKLLVKLLQTVSHGLSVFLQGFWAFRQSMVQASKEHVQEVDNDVYRLYGDGYFQKLDRLQEEEADIIAHKEWLNEHGHKYQRLDN